MTFIVPTTLRRFEVRESHSTPKGPRSRTLASFTELTDEVIEKAREKAATPPEPAELRRAARRAGAPVRQPPAERAARELIAELARGEQLAPGLSEMLVELLQKGYREGAEPSPSGEAARSIAGWMASTPEERGATLVDLLLLADALPSGGRWGKAAALPTPRFESRMTEQGRTASKHGAPPLPDKVLALHEALAKAKIPHAIGGAIALAYYAEPRATIDVDVNVFVTTERWREVVDALTSISVDADQIDAAALKRDRQCRIWWEQNAVDLFFAYDAIHQAMRKEARRVPFADTTIPILAPEHLAVCKAVFDRGKDWLDIEQMLIAVEELDVVELKRWLKRMVGPSDPRMQRLSKLSTALSSGLWD